MREECIIKSVKTDVKDAGIYVAFILVMVVIGWLCYIYNGIFTSILTGPVLVAILLSIGTDVMCVMLSMAPKTNNDPKNKPAPIWWTLAMYTLVYGLFVLVWSTWSITLPDLTIWFILNTVFVIVIMIGVRVWVRCKDEQRDGTDA